MKIVLVEWDDSGIGAHGWISKEDTSTIKTVPCVSVGIYLGDTEDGKAMKLIASLNDTCVLHGTSIPKACIKRIRYLKVK